MSYIQVASSLLPGKTNTPLDARSVVATVADISAIELPYVGLLVYCKADGKYYKITSLKAKTIGALSVANAAVDSYEEFNPGGNAIDTLTLTIPAPPSEGDSLHVEIHRKNSGEWNVALDSETDYAKVLYFDGMDFASCTSAGIPGMFQGNACCVSVGSALNQGDLCRYKWKVAGDSTGTQDGDWQGFVWPAATVCNGGVAYIDGIASGGMSSGGDEPISSGGTSSGGDEPISSGGTSGGEGGDDEPISSGGSYAPLGTSGYAIYDSANNLLSSGTVLTNGNILSGNRLEVYEGGQAINPLVSSGTVCVFSGGSTFRATFSSNGNLFVSGGAVNAISLGPNGFISVTDGGTASSIHVSSYFSCDAIRKNAAITTSIFYGLRTIMTVSSGGTASGIGVGSFCSAIVSSRGVASNLELGNAGSVIVSSGGTANGLVIYPIKGMCGPVLCDGMVYGMSISGMISCGRAHGIMIEPVSSSGHHLPALKVLGNGTATSTAIESRCEFHVLGTANSTTLTSQGTMIVSSGGTANSTTIDSSYSAGSPYGMIVLSGGIVNDTLIQAAGYAVLRGEANSTTINSQGTMIVSSSGIAKEISIHSGASLSVSAYGFASGATVDSLGMATISSGGVASSVMVSSGGTLTVSSGGMAFDVTSMTGAEIISSAGAYITYASQSEQEEQ